MVNMITLNPAIDRTDKFQKNQTNRILKISDVLGGNLSYMQTRQDMVKVAHYMRDRKLTNSAGGNFAVKVEDNRILVSPSLMSERLFYELAEEDFILIDYNMNILEGNRALSRETYMPTLILKNFETIGATIHAHPSYCMGFASQSKPIPNITEATMKRGVVVSACDLHMAHGMFERIETTVLRKTTKTLFI